MQLVKVSFDWPIALLPLQKLTQEQKINKQANNVFSLKYTVGVKGCTISKVVLNFFGTLQNTGDDFFSLILVMNGSFQHLLNLLPLTPAVIDFSFFHGS